MKTAIRKAIIYDDKCPMCAMYTAGFVKMGLLGEENRVSFAQLENQDFIGRIDPARSKDEIPLVDLDGGNTIYGLDAMLYILAQKMSFLRPLFRIRPIYWFFKKLYKLISFNRRVIVGGPTCSAKYDCTPAFNMKYRVVFMLVAAAFATWITFLFGEAVAPAWKLEPSFSGRLMLLLCGAGWLLHELSAGLLMRGERRVEYLGQMATLKIIGVFPLLLTIWFGTIAGDGLAVLALCSVFVSSSLMLWQHQRRVRNNNYSRMWTLAWFVTLQLPVCCALPFISFIR